MFRIGQKVECVNDCAVPGKTWGGLPHPIKGQVYTIARFVPSIYKEDELCFDLVEIDRGVPLGFVSWRFRPLISKSTESGMSILRRILNGQRIPENV